MAGLFEEERFDTVIHLAAESHVDRSIDGPGAFLETNIMGTYVLLQAARAQWEGRENVRFHHVSTDEVYGSLGSTGHFTEETPYDPSGPYSASKASSDHLVNAWHRTYGLPTTVSNCSNNYGPYQFPEKLIPLMINNAFQDHPLPVYGDGSNIRDWIHVDDFCTGIRTALMNGKAGEVYNFGGHCELTNLELVKRIINILGKSESLISFIRDRPGHDYRYAVDTTKARKELGWTPSVSFDVGLDGTIEWYLQHQEWLGSITSGAYQSYYRDHYGRIK
jgi:dTDP-glucose 4,6-dehydratase